MNTNMNKKVMLSGVQPSGCLTLGNYIGALKNWIKLQHDYQCFFIVVDLHALTVRQNPIEFRQRALDFLIQYVACGIDPEVNVIFFQSHVSAHSELAWILNCYTYMGELSRMTQFKEKSRKHVDNINVGLFTYPVLMAADILLYQTDLVPVGQDQKQHLELARDIAERFNSLYGEVFKIPEPYIPEIGAKIMSLQDPTKKMSKSDDNPNSYISLLDSPDLIVSKIKKAVTDSENLIKYSDDKPGIKNLITIYSCLTEKGIADVEQEFEGKGYKIFKEAVAEVIIEKLKPIQEKYKELSSDRHYFTQIYTKNAEKASAIANNTLKKVQEKIGLIVK